MNAPRTTPLVPGVSVIDLTNRFGVMSGQLIRHWSGFPRNKHGSPNCLRVEPVVPWYELTLRNPDGTVFCVLPCPRLQAAQILSAEMRTPPRPARLLPHLTLELETELISAVRESNDGYPHHLRDMQVWYEAITEQDIDAVSDALFVEDGGVL